jgi:hypothetical protein
MKRTRLAAMCSLSAMLVVPAGASAQTATTAASPIRVDLPLTSTPLSADHSGGDDAAEIAKKLQNPVGDLISVPFTNYTNFNVGPSKGTQDILQFQPVVPIHINEDWNIITRMSFL